MRIGNERLRSLLQEYQVVCHPVVISVLVYGNVRNCSEILHRLKALREGPIADHTKALYMVNAHHLYGQEWGGEMCIPGTRTTQCLHLGCTHQPKAKWFGKTLLLNPGSAGPQRFNLPVGCDKLKTLS